MDIPFIMSKWQALFTIERQEISQTAPQEEIIQFTVYTYPTVGTISTKVKTADCWDLLPIQAGKSILLPYVIVGYKLNKCIALFR